MQQYQQRPDQQLRDLLNTSNEPVIEFTDSNLILGKPSDLLGFGNANTQLNVRGIEGEDYKGQVKVYYNRLDLGVLFGGGYRAEFSALGQSSLYRLLPEISKALGITFTEEDLVNVDLKLLGEGEQVIIELSAKPGSIAYKGYTTVLFNRRQLMLTDVVLDRKMVQLSHPDPVLEGYKSAGLLTWGIDFTLLLTELTVNPHGAYYRGNWSNYTALKAKLADLYNIVDWPAIDASQKSTDSVKVYETKNLPDANRNFSHVAVQTGIRSNGYSGTAYFHYII